MVYTEADIFKESAADRRRLLKWDARKYKEVWLAFCKWVVERFDKGKGVTIINFIRLSWEQDELEREMYGEAADRALRPVWRMTEGFERAYTLQCKNKGDKRQPNDEANFERMEEINFHKIAMRYSNSLTKDVVFSCLREMFTRLGKAMMTGQHVQAEETVLTCAQVFCGVGDLVSRDRKTEFVFDSHYHRYIISKALQHSDGDSSALSDAERTVRIVINSDLGGDGEMEARLEPGDATFKRAPPKETVPSDAETCARDESFAETLDLAASAVAADAFDQRGGVWSGADIEEGVEDGSLGVSQIFNGNGSNEGWRLERVKRQAGGEEKLDYVGSALWQTVDNIAVEDSNQEVRNVVLGEQRRVDAFKKEAEESMAARQAVVNHGKTAKQLVAEAEEGKRIAAHKDKFGVKEDPFFIHLEPDPLQVLKKKKESQQEVRCALEEQIAARLMTSQRTREKKSLDISALTDGKQRHSMERLHFETQQLESADALLHKTLHQEHAQNRDKAGRLRKEWDKQVAHKDKVKRLARLPEVCLVDNRVSRALQSENGR